MPPAPLTAEERAKIEARGKANTVGLPLSGGWIPIAMGQAALADASRLLAANQYERGRADAAEKRAGRYAAALKWYADGSNYQEFTVEYGSFFGACEGDDAWAIAEHEDHADDPAGVARAAL